MCHAISIDTGVLTLSGTPVITGTSETLIGKAINCAVTVHGVFDYDESNSRTFNASVEANATNLASASAFYNALGKAIFKAVPKDFVKVYVVKSGTTQEVTATSSDLSSCTGVVLVEGLQKFVVGKLAGETCPLSVSFRLDGGKLGDFVWGKDANLVDGANSTKVPATAANVNSYISTGTISPTVYPANRVLANLEYFAAGERGDYYRGAFWPNDCPFVQAIDMSKTYDVLTVEYFWSGDAEDVQKSPRMIQVAGTVTGSGSVTVNVAESLYDTLNGFINGTSGSGEGA